MKIKNAEKKINQAIKIILHLFYWTVFCLFTAVVGFRLDLGTEYLMQNTGMFMYNLLWGAVQFYAFYFFFYRWIERQQFITYSIFSLLFSILLSLLFLISFMWFSGYSVHLLHFQFPEVTAGTFIIGQTGSLLRGFIRWFEDIRQKQEIEQTTIRNELDMLNAQLNPHFLFNTLNNIDSLIGSNPGKASEALVTLSEIMRYMLYEARKPLVTLDQEITHYQNIVMLQSLRLKDPEKIKFCAEAGESSPEVTPLLFLPFLENAFKYASFESNGIAVEIDLKGSLNKVEFHCSNRVTAGDSSLNRKTGGIGLSNVKRRLELIYKDRYELKTTCSDSVYTVQLTIKK